MNPGSRRGRKMASEKSKARLVAKAWTVFSVVGIIISIKLMLPLYDDEKSEENCNCGVFDYSYAVYLLTVLAYTAFKIKHSC